MDIAGALKSPVQKTDDDFWTLGEVATTHQDVWRILAYGDHGAGKSSLAISVMEWLTKQGKPEEVYLALLDNDGGTKPLVIRAIAEGRIPKEYQTRFKGRTVADWKTLVEKTEQVIGEAREHAAKYGSARSWVIVDNMKREWNWARDHCATLMYGVSEFELAIQKRSQAIEAGKALPVFNQRHDWGPINALHDGYVSRFILSGISYLFLTPEKAGKEKYDDDDSPVIISPEGQRNLRGTTDEVFRLWTDSSGYYMDLEKTRKAATKFRRMPDPSFGKFVDWLTKQNTKKVAPPAPTAATTKGDG